MLPTFNLPEWELPSDSNIPRSAPATARIPARFAGKQQMLLARLLEFAKGFEIVLVCSEDDTDEASWTPIREFDAQLMPWPLHQPLQEWDDVIEQSHYGRIVWFEGAMAVLHPDGRANWCNPQTLEQVPFRWHDGTHDWTNTPARSWKEALQRELHNPESDASFAHRWTFWSEQQRRETVWDCEGGLGKFHNLLGWMLTAQLGLEDSQRYAIRVLCLNYDNEYFGLEFWFEEWVNEQYVNKRVDWLVDWENMTNDLFSIRPRRELIALHPCASVQFPLNLVNIFFVERGPVSQHERIEALLRLSEWGRPRGIYMLSDEEEPFDLEEWELMPSAPESREGFATVCLRTNWLGEEREFLIRQVEVAPEYFVVFARLRHSSLPGNFALCASGDDEQPYSAISSKRSELVPSWLALIEHALLARLFFLDFVSRNQNGKDVIVLHPDGKGHLSWHPNSLLGVEGDAIFRWNAEGLQQLPSAAWLACLEEELADTKSDICFALDWAQLGENDRLNKLVHCKNGTLKELVQVLEWAMHCAPMFAEKLTSTSLSIRQQRLWQLNVWWHWNVWPIEYFAESYEGANQTIPSHLKSWGQAIIKWFAPSPNAEILQAHLCASDFYDNSQQRLLLVNTGLLTPSHQNEAKRLLSQWAQGKVPDQLLEILASDNLVEPPILTKLNEIGYTESNEEIWSLLSAAFQMP